MATASLPIAITLGDVAGIGPEIISQAFRDAPDQMQGCVVIGDVAAMQRAVDMLAHVQPQAPRVQVLPVMQLSELPRMRAAGDMPVLQISQALSAAQLPAWGQISAVAGQLAADAVVWAANAALRGEVASLVTAPLHKEALHLGVAVDDLPVRMMLANPELRTVLVSIHVSLREAIDAVTIENVLQTLRITHQAQLAATGRAPHMGVAGLNPHAGEGGLMGREELDILIPALQQARAEGLWVNGPLAPDTIFMRARAKNGAPGEFDVVIAMYHDQGLIPVKYLGVEQGVNVTLGLPLVRTSPDHGTAFDLAGTGRADSASLLAALQMARQLRQ